MTDSHCNSFYGGQFSGSSCSAFLPVVDSVFLGKYPGRGRRRRDRTSFSSAAIQLFESIFITERYPDIYLREHMSRKTGVPEERILVWFQNKRNRTKKRPNSPQQLSRVQSVKRPWENSEAESRTSKRPCRTASAVQRCLQMGISEEEIDSMCVIDSAVCSDSEEGDIDVVTVTPPRPTIKKNVQKQDCISFKPYDISPRHNIKVKTSCLPRSKPTTPQLTPLNFQYGLLPPPAVLSPFSAREAGNPFTQAVLNQLLFNSTTHASMFMFPPRFKNQSDCNKPATVTSSSRTSSPLDDSHQAPLDLSTGKVITTSSSVPLTTCGPMMVDPRLSPGNSSSGASSPDSGVSSGNVSRLNDSTPLDLSSSH